MELIYVFKTLSIKIYIQPDGTMLIDRERDPFDKLILEFYHTSIKSELIKNEVFIERLRERIHELKLHADEVHKYRETLP